MTRLTLAPASLSVFLLASIAIAQSQTALPAPSFQVVELTLENPRTPQSKSYLDLDTGKTFNYGDSNPADFTASRQWMRQSGADLMCETRPPSEGFAAYNLILVPANTAFADTNDYDTVMRQLRDAPAPDAFAMVNVVNSLPKTYLFKTTEGAIGVLEAIEVSTEPSGLKLRYKILPKPVVPEVIARGRGRGGRGVAPQQQQQVAQQQQLLQQQAVRQQQQLDLQALQRQLGGLNTVATAGPLPPINAAPVNPPVAAGGRRGARGALGPGGIPQTPTDRTMASTVARLVQTQQNRLQELTQTYGPNHPATLDAQRRLDLLQRLADPQQQPTTPMEELLRQRFELQQKLATIEASIAAETQTAAQLREQMKRVQASVDKLEADQKAQARGPTTGPATAPSFTP